MLPTSGANPAFEMADNVSPRLPSWAVLDDGETAELGLFCPVDGRSHVQRFTR